MLRAGVGAAFAAPESRYLSNGIERTRLGRRLEKPKNYSAFVLHSGTTKPENPSTATLDTLARYLVGAPATTEVQRKREGVHFGYWFRYLEQFADGEKEQNVR